MYVYLKALPVPPAPLVVGSLDLLLGAVFLNAPRVFARWFLDFSSQAGKPCADSPDPSGKAAQIAQIF